MYIAEGEAVPTLQSSFIRYMLIFSTNTKCLFRGQLRDITKHLPLIGYLLLLTFCVGSFECTEHNFVKASLFIEDAKHTTRTMAKCILVV